ncbi:MAG: phage portal protein [Bulleidia sp.]
MMSFFDFFKRNKTIQKAGVMPMDTLQWSYQRFNGGILEMDMIRACVDALARSCAKMQLQPIRESGGQKQVDKTSDVAHVLNRPNAYMSTYDFLYKIAAMYYTANNAFIWPEYEGGTLIALWPINYRSFKLKKLNGNLYATFTLKYTREYTVPYENLIHLRGHFMTDELCGTPNTALFPAAELLNAQNQGIINGIKNSAIIRGILKSVNVIKEVDLEKARKQFVKDNLSLENNGGVIAVDGKFDYTPITSAPYVVNAETMAAAKTKVLDYFGISEDFVQSKFTADQYEAVYEGKLEPYSVMLTDALTHGLYTQREIGFGNRIEATMSKMKYQPMSAITSMIGATRELGLFTRNEYRDMLGYAPLTDEQGGNDILTALNNYGAVDSGDEEGDDKEDGESD